MGIMGMQKGQATIEYLILVAVAIIIATIIVFAIMNWIPGLASELKSKQATMISLGTSPIATKDSKMTNDTLLLHLQNIGYDTVVLDNISVEYGSITLTGDVSPSKYKLMAGDQIVYNISGISCDDTNLSIGQSYQFDNYSLVYDVVGGLKGQRILSDKPLTVTCRSCHSGLSYCNYSCVNASNDMFNCGGCGINCSLGQDCINGTCIWPSCNAECGDTLNSSTSLNCSLSCSGTALMIGGNNITLDCNGHTLNYSKTSAGYGIDITNHNLTTIENCNITQTNGSVSGAHAIYLANATNNLIRYTNISVNSSNGYGISLSSGSNSNNFTNNRIMSMNSYGIRVSSSSGNRMFNNLINASTPARADSSLNYWNATLAAGTNIIGGPYRGGNFWANPSGTGYSQTCEYNSSGLCINNYTINSSNIDYLPLVMPPFVLFMDPTPANGTTLNQTYAELNVSIDLQAPTKLSSFLFNWNGTNYSIFDDSLLLAMNLNNNSEIGDNGSVAVDISKYGNNGTINGAVWDSSGKYGGALSFNGTGDNIQVADADSLTPSNLTLSIWFKWDGVRYNNSVTPYQNISTLLCKGNLSSCEYCLIMSRDENDTNNTFSFYLNGSLRTEFNVTGGIDTGWHQLVATYNSSNATLYLDGVLNSSGDYSVGIPNTAENLSIGQENSTDSPYNWGGLLDEIRVWNLSFSADEVWFQYQSEFQKYNSTEYRFYNNLSALINESTYTYYGWANDTSGRSADTRNRSLIINAT